MSRLTTTLVLLVGALAGGLGVALATRTAVDENRARAIAQEVVAEIPKSAGLTQSGVESIVADLIARQPKQNLPGDASGDAVAVDAATINPLIEDYLLKNPRILQRVSEALTVELTAEKVAQTKSALTELQPVIYDAPGQIVLGNPDGDVTLVEMFDYNCGYCRQALPDLAALLDQDKNLKVILKEFPILSQGSIDAARIAIQVAEADVDYWTFHQTLFTSRGQVDKAVALKVASDLGLNPITLEMGMNTARVNDVLQASYKIADRLQITGTPTFIIGDEVIPGAVGLDALKERIANMRECGATVCPVAIDQPG